MLIYINSYFYIIPIYDVNTQMWKRHVRICSSFNICKTRLQNVFIMLDIILEHRKTLKISGGFAPWTQTFHGALRAPLQSILCRLASFILTSPGPKSWLCPSYIIYIYRSDFRYIKSLIIAQNTT